MITSIRGKEAQWNREIWDKWYDIFGDIPEGKVTKSNYYTPRPYRNKYDSGSKDEGFCFTLKSKDRNEYSVYTVKIN